MPLRLCSPPSLSVSHSLLSPSLTQSLTRNPTQSHHSLPLSPTPNRTHPSARPAPSETRPATRPQLSLSLSLPSPVIKPANLLSPARTPALSSLNRTQPTHRTPLSLSQLFNLKSDPALTAALFPSAPTSFESAPYTASLKLRRPPPCHCPLPTHATQPRPHRPNPVPSTDRLHRHSLPLHPSPICRSPSLTSRPSVTLHPLPVCRRLPPLLMPPPAAAPSLLLPALAATPASTVTPGLVRFLGPANR